MIDEAACRGAAASNYVSGERVTHRAIELNQELAHHRDEDTLPGLPRDAGDGKKPPWHGGSRRIEQDDFNARSTRARPRRLWIVPL